MRRFILLSLWSLLSVAIVRAQNLPPCIERPTVLTDPWTNSNYWCLEQVIHDSASGEWAFTALAAAPDGTLYAARPLAGQILALHDSDGDLLPDTAEVIVDGLTHPNGLAYYRDSLYISGGPHLYRLSPSGELEVLVDDLPSGAGFWTGGLTIGPDERIYVGIGAPCDHCQPQDTERGAILSVALDGSDRRVVATGLRNPADLAFLNDTLWTVDTARDDLASTPDLDELNRVEPGLHFGWPFCIGADNRPDLPGTTFDCASAAPPTLSFPTHSAPLGLAAYTSATFPRLEGTLLIVLGGTHNEVNIAGFTLVFVQMDNAGSPTGYEIIIPEPTYLNNPNLSLQEIIYQGSSFWPHHPYDVAVSAEGWVYVSMGGGRILALRPT